MVEYRTKIGDLFVSFYLNGGSKSIILANGIPSYVTKHHPLVKFCKDEKINLFIPRYYGSFESCGDFTLNNSIKTIQETIEMFFSGKTKELFGNNEVSWSTDNLFILGYSFGAFPVAHLDLPGSENIKVILNSPFLGSFLDQEGEYNLQKEFSFIERAYPNLYQFNTLNIVEEYVSASATKLKDFFLIYGEKDNVISQKEIESLEKVSSKIYKFEGGHSVHLPSLKKIICGS